MFNLHITGASMEDLKSNLEAALAALGGEQDGADEKAVKRAVGSTATVSAAKKNTKAEADDEAEDEKPAKAGKKATKEEPEDDDGLEDGPSRDEVKELLLEVKRTFVKDATAVGKLVGKYGAQKLAEVEDSDLAALAADARKKLKSAK